MWQRLWMITGTLAAWTWVAFLNLPPYAAALITVALVTWYVIYRVRLERHRVRNATAMEQALLPDAAVAAGQAEARFVAALHDMKSRNVHQAPLVDLPIYVALGAPQSGIRSLLAHAGVRWRARELKPIMGCQWWIDDTCIILRPTGADPKGTRACMEVLRRYRRPAPVNGILVTLSLGDLLDLSESQLKRNAQDLRTQLETIQDPLHVRAPVYLVLTQADRLPGFSPTFAKATSTERQSVWGDTFYLRADSLYAQEALGHMLDAMVQNTSAQTLHTMQNAHDADARELIYQFPDRLAALRGPLLTWSNAFFAPAHRRANPRLRAAFVCSAAPKETMALHGSLPGQASHGLGAPFFTSSIISTALLPDADRPTSVGAVGERPWARVATLAAAVVMLLLPVASYVSNYYAFSRTRQTVENLLAERKNEAGHFASLQSMDAMANVLEALNKDSSQASFLNVHMGMNQSAELFQTVHKLYLDTVRDYVVAPLLGADNQRMVAFSQHYAQKNSNEDDDATTLPDEQEFMSFFNMLKTHLLCTTESQDGGHTADVQDNAWLTATVARRWGKATGEPEDSATLERLQRHVATYVDAMRADSGLRLARNSNTVAAVRSVLVRVPQEVAVIAQLTNGVDSYSLSLQDLLGDTTAPVYSDKKIRGAYTRAGWENVVRGRVAQMTTDAESLWVLGAQAINVRRAFLEASSNDARDVIYWHNYANAWHDFVGSIHMQASKDDPAPDTAKTSTQRLQVEYPAAYQRLLHEVQYNLKPRHHRTPIPCERPTRNYKRGRHTSIQSMAWSIWSTVWAALRNPTS